MAKTNAPLGSFSAHGGLMKSLTYRVTKGFNVVSAWAKPGSYRQKTASVSQLEQRGFYSDGVLAWNSLTTEQKETYAINALPLFLTGFNLFMREYLNNPVIISFRLLETGDRRLLETGFDLLLE